MKTSFEATAVRTAADAPESTPVPLPASSPQPEASSSPAPVEKARAVKVSLAAEKPTEIKPEKAPAPVQRTKVKLPESEPVEPAVVQPDSANDEVAGAPSHEAWDKLLRTHVTGDGMVNYQALLAAKQQLVNYLKVLADNPVQNNWTRNEKMAYWINAYNAFTVKLVLDHYPVNSIMDIKGGKPWDWKWIELGDKTYSLNQIEHQIIRPQFKDARIHFAVNCAARSCPPLLNRAWTADRLTTQLEQQASGFINNPNFNQLSTEGAKISKIFEWYAEDFGSDIVDYLNKYSKTKVKPGGAVTYLDYNWELNR